MPLGVVHRDVSPANILVSHTGDVKLIDFGITRSRIAERQTVPGEIKGKLRYMSPEQVIGADLDARSDLFAVGIVLAEMLTCVDIRFFITTLIVQRETGGNLAEILESISRLIRQRFELLGKVAALSAEGKLSGIVLVLLPFGIGALLWFINPTYMSLLITDPMGKDMLMISGALMVIGSFMMKKLCAIKV